MIRLCIHLPLCERLSKTAYAELMQYAFESSSADIVNHITVNITSLKQETCAYLASQYLCLPLERRWLEKNCIQTYDRKLLGKDLRHVNEKHIKKLFIYRLSKYIVVWTTDTTFFKVWSVRVTSVNSFVIEIREILNELINYYKLNGIC